MRYAGLRDLRHLLLGAARASVCTLALVGIGAANLATARGEEIKIGGTGGALGTMRLLADAYKKLQTDVNVVIVPNLGSSGGIKAVLSGAIQIGLSSRPLKEAEIGQGAESIEYARTPFVFATPLKNGAVSAVSVRQLVEIYSGKMERWPDGTKIRLVLRPESDSDTELVGINWPELRQVSRLAGKRPGALIGVTDGEAADYLEKLPGAIGTTTLALILSEQRSLKALKLDDVQPSTKGIADGSYPYYKSLLLVTGPKTSASARKFIAFVQFPAGREILARTGHWVK